MSTFMRPRIAGRAGSRLGEKSRKVAREQHLALVQHDDEVGIGDLVDEVRCPQHAEPLLLHEPAHDADHALARADVEADGRLVEQEAARPVQERAGDLDAPRLAAGEIAHLLVGPVGKADGGERLGRAPARLAGADAVQGGVIEQVLLQREIAVERLRLEHHAEALQRCPRPAPHVVTEDVDLAGDVVVEAGDQREERRLTRAVEAEQHGEGAARHGERHVVEHQLLAEAVAHALDDQSVRPRGLGLLCGVVHLTMNFPVRPFCSRLRQPQVYSPGRIATK
jgi:hypothetical protein